MAEPGNNSGVYLFDEFVLDPKARMLSRNGQPIPLTPRVFDTLLAFVLRPGETISKEELMNTIWPDSFVEEANLTQNVAVLRKALGDNSRQHRYIVTVPGTGYRFVPEVFKPRGSEDNGGTWAAAEVAEAFPLPARRSYVGWIVLGILTSILLAIASYLYFRKSDGMPVPAVAGTRQITSFSGLDLYPSFSPTGGAIAFASNKTGVFEIYTIQLVPGAAEFQLTTDGNQNCQPEFSPDGTRVAYHSILRRGIWVIPSSGGTPKRLADFGSNPSWSPDGTSIVFQSEPLNDLAAGVRNAMPPSTLWTVPSDGNGEAVRLTTVGMPEGGHGAPVWSPDGKRIMFDSNDAGTSRLWSVASDGTDVRSVFNDETYAGGVQHMTASEAVFTSDGRSIIFVANLGHSINATRIGPTGEAIGEPFKLFDASAAARLRHVAVSPDGKRILYSAISTSSNLFLTRLDERGQPGETLPLTKSADARSVSPAFSPDGKTIAFQHYTTGASAAHIRLMNSDGSNQRQVTTGPGFNPTWFPEGDRVGFSYSTPEGSEYRFAAVDGSAERRLFASDHDMYYGRLAPDGRSVLFNSNRSGTINIWQIPIEGGPAKQLTFDKELAGYPSVSRDGKWIGLQIKRGDDTHIAFMPFGPGEPIQLTSEPGQSWAGDWAPDNDRIAFPGRRGLIWNIYSVSRTTREVKRLTNFDKINSYVRYPAWSPLNNGIAYEYAESTGNIWMIELK